MGGAAGAALVLALVLAPGLAYRVGRERRLPERKRRGAADSASLLVAGASSTALALWGFAALRGLMPTHTPDVGQLMGAPRDYIAEQLPYVAAWATGIYAVAFALAAAEGRLGLLARLAALSRLGGRLGGISHESAWWLAFKPDHAEGPGDDPPVGSATFVWCALTDGDYLGGQLQFFNSDTTENLDRDLLLRSPIRYLAAAPNGTGPSQATELVHVSSAVISASRIRYLTVSHLPVTASDENRLE